jgi:DNA-directed RNA polymerase subunit M/transcription elongation factor TFIIS
MSQTDPLDVSNEASTVEQVEEARMNTSVYIENITHICVCGKQYENEDSFIKHKNKVHDEIVATSYNCGKCEFSTKFKEELNNHIDNTHKPRPTFECIQCGKKYVSKIALEEHMKDHNPSNPFICYQCNFQAMNQENLEKHMESQHEPVRNQKTCNICGYKGETENDLAAHKESFHENQLLLLRAIRDLTENVKTLSADVFYLKSNSIIIKKMCSNWLKVILLKK